MPKLTPLHLRLLVALRALPGKQIWAEIMQRRAWEISEPDQVEALIAEIKLDYIDNPRLITEMLSPEAMELLTLKPVLNGN